MVSELEICSCTETGECICQENGACECECNCITCVNEGVEEGCACGGNCACSGNSVEDIEEN